MMMSVEMPFLKVAHETSMLYLVVERHSCLLPSLCPSRRSGRTHAVAFVSSATPTLLATRLPADYRKRRRGHNFSVTPISGTIHSFVNQFFAMPMLRSMGQKVDVIDDLVFADKAMDLLQRHMFGGLRNYLEHQNNGDGIVSTLYYRTAELEVHVESGKLPGIATQSYKALVRLKKCLPKRGIFRHRDMFAYADLAFKTCPHLVEVIHRRFPIVFIDEMQDTSWEQEALLNRIFDGKSVMQRFGEVGSEDPIG